MLAKSLGRAVLLLSAVSPAVLAASPAEAATVYANSEVSHVCTASTNVPGVGQLYTACVTVTIEYLDTPAGAPASASPVPYLGAWRCSALAEGAIQVAITCNTSNSNKPPLTYGEAGPYVTGPAISQGTGGAAQICYSATALFPPQVSANRVTNAGCSDRLVSA